MKKRMLMVLVLALLIGAPLALGQEKKAEDLYAKALLKENGEQNPAAALDIYLKVYKDSQAPQNLIQKAFFRMGICLKKMGKKEEAKGVFQKILQNNQAPAPLRAKAGVELLNLFIPQGKTWLLAINSGIKKEFNRELNKLKDLLAQFQSFDQLRKNLENKINGFLQEEKKKGKSKLEEEIQKLKKEIQEMQKKALEFLREGRGKELNRLVKQIQEKSKEFAEKIQQELAQRSQQDRWKKLLKRFFKNIERAQKLSKKLSKKLIEEALALQKSLERELQNIKIPPRLEKTVEEIERMLKELQRKGAKISPKDVERQMQNFLRELQRELKKQKLNQRVKELQKILKTSPLPKKLQERILGLRKSLEMIQKNLPKSLPRGEALKRAQEEIEKIQKRIQNLNLKNLPKEVMPQIEKQIEKVQMDLKRELKKFQEEIERLKKKMYVK